ncbi:MAG TPA: hypothetical protein VM328_05985 [Fimbriimonadaceae bacterium]|nr:hypothetical protein [Fimbriimonadaceae bacterium]
MKKRKPPYLLVSLLVVLFGVAFFFNPLTNQKMDVGRGGEAEMPQGEARPSASSEQLAASASQSLSKSGKPAQMVQDDNLPGGMPGKSGAPTVIMPSVGNYKPTPNEAATSSHWFRPQSAKQKEKG